ncbi:variable surface lipoprotein [Mycoplasma struthionis]|uniref:Variable surface lipoprotein n=1 Tax=Mycoplasma struthionis TaxID=538220 RepID=A0A3G8LGY7_9MOLU|nr:variable surface lipoprotein [Mycoplasma struthionis]AZG68791.1 hypothetical protein EGN60_02375 [Mycoplasma struthionis]
MKTRKLISFLSISAIVTMPLVAISCKKEEKKVIKQQENVEMSTNLGLSIAKKALNQENVNANKVVEELKAASTLKNITDIFNKYNIKYDISEIPENATYSVEPSTHAHANIGQIHLDIKQTISSTSSSRVARFDIIGFLNEQAKQVKIGNYILNTTSKIKANPETLKQEIKKAQDQGFESLINTLKKYVDITEENNLENEGLEFKFNLDKTRIDDANKITFLEILSYKKSNPNDVNKINAEFYITNLAE